MRTIMLNKLTLNKCHGTITIYAMGTTNSVQQWPAEVQKLFLLAERSAQPIGYIPQIYSIRICIKKF